MKKVISWILVLALTAALAVGGTLAYLTDTDEDVNVMTLGQVKIDQLEYERVDTETENEDATVQEFHDNKPLYPSVIDKDKFDWTTGDSYVNWDQIGGTGSDEIWDPENINNELDKMVFVKNTGDYDAYVRSVIAFEAGNYATLEEYLNNVHLNINTEDYIWEWVEVPQTIGEGTYYVATATYKNILTPGELTPPSLLQIALDPSATNEDVAAFGDTFQVLVKSQGIQADGFTDPETALNEGFGEIIDQEIPWETDQPITGIDVRTALHNRNGDPNDVITTTVTNVVFGLNGNYPQVVSNYPGTLVDDEQDVPVYAYYVEENGGLTVYFLANDDVFLPKDSTKLFNGMTALVEVNSENVNASRVETFRGAFQNCKALPSLDVSNWGVSAVTDLSYMFNNCSKLVSVDGIEDWDVSKVTDLRNMFNGCNALKELNLADWDVSNVTDMQYMFNNCNSLVGIGDTDDWDTGNVTNMKFMFTSCKALTEVNSTNWDTSNVTDMQQTFCFCHKLESVDTANWDVGKVTTFYGTFYECKVLDRLATSDWDTGSATNITFMFQNANEIAELDVSGWDLSNVEQMNFTFFACKKLTSLDVSDWDVSNCAQFNGTFSDCTTLTDVDVSKWDTSSATTMEGTFNHCYALENVDVSNWDTSKVTSFGSMFQGDGNLTGLDVSKWNTGSAVKMNHMFYGCKNITTLDVSNFDMSNVTTTSHMFADCNNLTGLDVSKWNMPNLTSMDGIFNDCWSLKTLNVGNWNTVNVVEFSQAFDACTSLEEIIGLENWDTSKAKTFEETFNACYSLKELNLSNLDTRHMENSYYAQNNDWHEAFARTTPGVTSLEKLIIGENFSFDGNGTVQEAYQFKVPASTSVEGWDGHWYNVETGVAYLPEEVPEEVAATYVAVNPNP